LSRGSGVIPWAFVLLCGLSLTLLTLLITGREERAPSERAPVRAEPERALPAFLGTRPAAEGQPPLVARLTRLHADPARQSFDARALRERLVLGMGEPWRLELTHEGGPDSAAIEVGELSVIDERGVALNALRPGRRSADPAVGDPVSALLGPPAQPLEPGGALQWVLWGRAPEGNVRLRGLAGAAADGLAGEEGAELPMAPTEVPSGTVPQSLARRPVPVGEGSAPR
jgi:hypothetical protein